MKPMGKYERSVSIAGVGCTRFADNQKTPGREHLTEGDLFGYAVLTALEDAGLEPRDVQQLYVGCVNAFMFQDSVNPMFNVLSSCGMNGLGVMSHNEACVTGNVALDLAVQAVASGQYDIVVTGGLEMSCSATTPGRPAIFRETFPMEKLVPAFDMAYDTAYDRYFAGGIGYVWDGWTNEYVMKYGISDEEIDLALNSLAYHMRRMAKLNPLSFFNEDYDDLAAQHGMKDGMEYLSSMYNPFVTNYLRSSSIEVACDGAAALVVCATDVAEKLKSMPIEVLGIGASAYGIGTPNFERRARENAINQVYGLTGMSGKDLDIFFPNDCELPAQLMTAEAAGYIPEGQAWKYAIDGRIAYDGDRPMNTNGGRTSFGHAHAASGIADTVECVKQMRGTAGATQVAERPHVAMMSGFCAQNSRAAILKTVE